MRIISKTKDYFDTAGQVDPTVVFVRNQLEVSVDIEHPDPYGGGRVIGLLGFCGKFYPYIHKKIEAKIHPTNPAKSEPEKHFYYYSVEEYRKSPFWEAEHTRSFYFRYTKSRQDESMVKFFDYWKDSDKLFVAVDAPYFKIKSFNGRHFGNYGTAITNPSLIDMQFGKVIDAHTAFQQVQFYLTNQLVKTKDPDDVDDKYKISGHGFDKYSFRHPTKLKDLK